MVTKSKSNGDNLNNVGCGISRIFRNKKRGYPKEKMSLKQTVRTKIRGTYIET
jgi:hypothetical protein